MKKRIVVALFAIIAIALILFWTNLKKETDLPLDSTLVKELDQMTHPSEDAMLLKELYEKNTISDSYRIAVGMNAYLKKQEEVPEFLSKEVVLNSVKDLFAIETIEHQSVYLLNEYGCGYAFQNDTYERIFGCDGDQFSSFKRKIVKATKRGNTITFTEKVLYLYNDWDEVKNRVSIYNNVQKEERLAYLEIPSNEEFQINFDAYLDKASTYTYTFQKQKGIYKWIRFEKIDS